jgi:ubiquinone/menaquinone biosynthesis C-methylase UbiE
MSGSASVYALGRSENEYQRLMVQSRVVRRWTESYLLASGLRPGAKVLDLGSGMGDVSMLAASIVGASGSVLGVDNDASIVDSARQRVESERLSGTVRFEVSTLEDFRTTERFDAVIGRFILLYQPDPVAALRRAAELLQPGGTLVFHEMDFTARDQSSPRCVVFDECYGLLQSSFKAAGAYSDMGRRLAHTFFKAGLSHPAVQVDVPAAAGPDSPMLDWLARSVQSLKPIMDSVGLSLPPGVGFDNLLSVFQEAVAEDNVLCFGPTQYGVWARVP